MGLILSDLSFASPETRQAVARADYFICHEFWLQRPGKLLGWTKIGPLVDGPDDEPEGKPKGTGWV